MAEVISKRSIVYDITFDTKGARQGAQQTEKALKGVTKAADSTGSSFANLGKQISGAFALQEVVRQIGQFTREAFELGLKADGVKKAFANLNKPDLLDNLRKATRGVVDDFTLMQAAVKADKFKIPLNNLALYLKFAQQRAKDTGQSVDELVGKIVDGIGKQAVGRMDDLGLSTKELQREFDKTGDFAKATAAIIQRELSSADDAVKSNTERVEQLRTSWRNFQSDVGTALVNSVDDIEFIITAPLEGHKKIFNRVFNLAADNIGLLDQLREKWAAQAEEARRAGEQMNASLAGQNLFASLTNVALNTTAFSLLEINARLKELAEEFEKATDPKIQAGLAGQIQAFQKMKKAIEDLLTAAPAGSIKNLEKQISDLQEALSLTPSTDPTFQKLTAQITNLGEQLERIKTKFTDITKLNKILTTDVETSTQQLASQFYAVGQAIDELTADVRIAQTEFIQLSDGTMIKGLQTNTIKTMKEVLEAQAEGMKTQRDLQIQYATEALQALVQLTEEGSNAHIGFATIAILANQAQALSGAVAAATQAALVTGGTTLPILLPAFIAAALSTFAQMNALLSQAKSSKSASATAFAEGEIDIHRPGEQRGKDSISAVIMPGESVIRTDRTRQYKPFLEAIQAGNLEEIIRVNYVEPALVMQALNGSKVDSTEVPDYSDKFYRQYLATGEGNINGKRMIGILASIDRKLTTKPSRYSR